MESRCYCRIRDACEPEGVNVSIPSSQKTGSAPRADVEPHLRVLLTPCAASMRPVGIVATCLRSCHRDYGVSFHTVP